MSKELLTCKLSGSNFDIAKMKASEVSKIQTDFFKRIEKIDKNIFLKKVEEGCLGITIFNPSLKLLNNLSFLKETLTDFFKKYSFIEHIDFIDTVTNQTIYEINAPKVEEDIFINVIGFFEGEVKDVGGTDKINIHIKLDEAQDKKPLIFNIPLEETAREWANCLYRRVRIYAEVKQDLNGKIIEGLEIISVELIEKLDKKKVDEEFENLVKRINIKNFTQLVIDERHGVGTQSEDN